MGHSVWVGQNLKETRNWVVSELEKRSKEQAGGTFARNSTDHICERYTYTFLPFLSFSLSLSLSLSYIDAHTLSLSHISKIILYLLLYRPFLLCSFSSLSQSTHDNTRICLIIILPSLVTKLWWYYISLWPVQQNFFNT